MFVVAVDHLLDVVVVVAVVADVLPVADPVAAVGNGPGDWHDSLSLDPDPCHWLRRIGDGAVARPNLAVPVAASDTQGVAMAHDCATGSGSRHPAQDALHPG